MGNKQTINNQITIVSVNKPVVIINNIIYWLLEEDYSGMHFKHPKLLKYLVHIYEENVSRFEFIFYDDTPNEWHISGSFIRPDKNIFLNIDENNHVSIWNREKGKHNNVTDQYYKRSKALVCILGHFTSSVVGSNIDKYD